MANGSVEIKASDIAVTDEGSIVISGEPAVQLMNALVKRHDHAMDKLKSDAASMRANDIQMDPDGSVRITNPDFATVIKERIARSQQGSASVQFLDNIICNIFCDLL